jgi:hypothetical protein
MIHGHTYYEYSVWVLKPGMTVMNSRHAKASK